MINLKKITATLFAAVCMLTAAVPTFAADNKPLTLDYTDSKELITSQEDLFSNVSEFMPGDVLTDTLTIENKNSKSVELFFKSIPLPQKEYELDEDYDLLNKINLKIDYSSNEVASKTIYDGPLNSGKLNNIISLGNFKTNEKGEFKFTLNVPSSLKNKYNMTQTKVKWYFALNENEIPGTPKQPHTGAGNNLNLAFAGGIVGISAIIIGTIVLLKSRKDDV